MSGPLCMVKLLTASRPHRCHIRQHSHGGLGFFLLFLARADVVLSRIHDASYIAVGHINADSLVIFYPRACPFARLSCSKRAVKNSCRHRRGSAEVSSGRKGGHKVAVVWPGLVYTSFVICQVRFWKCFPPGETPSCWSCPESCLFLLRFRILRASAIS